MKTEHNDLEEESMPTVEPVHSNDDGEELEEKKEIMISKKSLWAAGAFIVLLFVLYFTKGLLVVAVVNGSPVSRFAVVNQLERAGGKAALDNLITRKLIAGAANKQGITVSAADVDAEIKKIEAQIASSGQGATLDMLLAQRGMTRGDLITQVTVQKQVEKLLVEKVQVTDDEVEKYLVDNKITLPKGEEAVAKEQIKEQIKQQKITNEGQILVDSLRAAAKISYFVDYK